MICCEEKEFSSLVKKKIQYTKKKLLLARIRSHRFAPLRSAPFLSGHNNTTKN